MDEDILDYSTAKAKKLGVENPEKHKIISLMCSVQGKASEEITRFLTIAQEEFPREKFDKILISEIASLLIIFTDNFDKAYTLINEIKDLIIKQEKNLNEFQQSGLK